MLSLAATGATFAADEAEQVAPTVGLLDGSVVTVGTGNPVAEALVTISDGTKERYGRSDENGRFSVELPAGRYTVTVEHSSYGSQDFPDIVVSAGVVQQSVFRVGDPGLALDRMAVPGVVEEIVVLGTYKPQGAEEARWSESVLDVITAEDFEIAGDSNAVDALARVTGLTIVNDKYVYVRGMGERYSNTTFNQSLLPSPDPLRRVIPMDLFPTGVLETVDVQKTYAPDQYGDFSGGSVGLRTREIPEDPLRQIQFSVETNSETTGVDALTYDGGDDDWTGMDDGFRDLPSAIKRSNDLAQDLNDPLTQTTLARSLNQNWDTQFEELPASWGVDATFGQRWDAGEEGAAGALLGFMYKNDYAAREELRQEGQTLDGANPSVQDSGSDRNYSRTQQTIDLAALLNLEWELDEANRLRSITFLTRRTDKNSLRYFYFDENKGSGEDAVETTFEWEERELFTQQFTGEHFFGEEQALAVDWFATISRAERDKPDTRSYVYERPGGSAAETAYLLSDDQGNLQRTWENVQDDAYGLGFNVERPFDWGSANTTTVKAGLAWNDKDRETDNLRFEYLTSTYQDRGEFEQLRGELIGDVMDLGNLGTDLLELQLNSRNTNLVAENYEGQEELLGYYLMLDNEFGDDWRLMVGARVEDFDMSSKPVIDQTGGAAPAAGELEETDVLPTATLTWLFTDDMQIRFGVSRTVNRPDLREIGPVRFVDPETRYSYIGNPALEQATIDNADLRWEWYFGGQDNLQIALFYKDFSDPIEIEVIPGAPVLRRPFNAEAATNQGVELAIRKQLDFVDVPVVRDMYVKFNGAVIDSEVDLPQSIALFDSSGRALQGQSEWVVNAQLTWDDIERDIQASILFNWADERLVDVGTDNLPGAWEEPPPLLDFVYSQGLELFGQRYTVKLKAQNLIDEDVEVTRAGVLERAYNTGRTFSIGVSAEL
jgi:TonB-dependent receptor